MGELYDQLMEYEKKDIYPFHMPGHKRNIDINLSYKMDITEIEGFDDLHKSEGILENLKQRIASIYKADRAFIMPNGSTSGILTAISAVTEYKDTILIARNCHKSVYNAINLRGLKTEYIYPDTDKEMWINNRITPEEVEKHLIKNPKIKAVVITSPTYEGIVSDITKISEMVHSYNAVLIVDAAHGAHLGFDNFFPENPVTAGADITIMSLHKTLPAATQSAIMCVKGNRVDLGKIDRFFHTFITSSPSYLMMCSIEYCLDYVEKNGFEEYIELLNSFYKECKPEKIKIIRTDDPGKIVISTVLASINGEELKTIFREKYRLEMEMSSKEYVIAMTSLCDTKEGFDRLKKAILEIDEGLDYKKDTTAFAAVVPDIKMTIEEAYKTNFKKEHLQKVEGCISHEFIFAYPPGIPIITPGEVFSREIIEMINLDLEYGINMYGIDENNLVEVCL